MSFRECPEPGSGVHPWLLSEANRCRMNGMTQADTASWLERNMRRKPQPREIDNTIDTAWNTTGSRFQRGPKLDRIRFQPARLDPWKAPPRHWRHWLWERSPVIPTDVTPVEFLRSLYRSGDVVAVLTDTVQKTPAEWFRWDEATDRTGLEGLRRGNKGVWFLTAPVDGKFHADGDSYSCRSSAAAKRFEYMVLESDVAEPHTWLSFLAKTRFKIAAIYTSGGRSIHALARMGCRTKDEYDAKVNPLKPDLKRIGVDPQTLSAIRLSRLPGCWREEKSAPQSLLYLNPGEWTCPIEEMPVRSTRADFVRRWRENTP